MTASDGTRDDNGSKRVKMAKAEVVMVVEETGWGIVPATKIGGLFRDRQGWLAQCLEQHASESWLVIQGRAVNLSQLGILVP